MSGLLRFDGWTRMRCDWRGDGLDVGLHPVGHVGLPKCLLLLLLVLVLDLGLFIEEAREPLAYASELGAGLAAAGVMTVRGAGGVRRALLKGTIPFDAGLPLQASETRICR